jgi:NADH-quinone oxidoreductase subunit J
MEQYVFWPTAVISLLSALFVIITPNAVHAAIALVANFFTLAVFYVLLQADFLAAVQVIVYAGAIMVLFLFVIMLLGVDRMEDLRETIKAQRFLATTFSGALGIILVIVVRAAFQRSTFQGLDAANRAGNVQGVGRLLFTGYLWPFEVTSLLLIIAAIAAMVVGKRRGPSDPSMTPEDEDA